jgi:hypothetical protein
MIPAMITPKKQKRREEGQSLVEISISFVFFFFFLLGLLDLGRVYFIMVALEDSAGEAASFMSINPQCRTATDCPDPNNGQWRARNAVGDMLNWTNAQIIVTYPTTGRSTGNHVRVNIQYPFTPLTPIISAISGGQLTLVGDATQIILVE